MRTLGCLVVQVEPNMNMSSPKGHPNLFEMIKQIFHAVETEEFFWQELTEEEISDRVTQQLDESRNDSTPLNIEIILQRIGIERSKERETGTIAKWLVEPWRGTARIHWLVSCAYISCPVSSLLVLVVAMEWGIRGSAQLPEWFKRFSWFKIVFGNGGLNPPILNMLLFSTTALANAIGAPFWAALATKVQPRLLLAVAMLLQVPLLITMLTVHRPNVSLATIVVFLQGLSSSGSVSRERGNGTIHGVFAFGLFPKLVFRLWQHPSSYKSLKSVFSSHQALRRPRAERKARTLTHPC